MEQGTGIDLHFRFAKIDVRLRQAVGGNARPRCIQKGSIPFLRKKKTTHKGWISFLEQGTGIEPASVAWEATILPMN